jgi:flavin reductase (DIM6/NTAB) family NADH-FMN oxidoreductase RutF
MKKSLGPKTLLYPSPTLVIASYDAAGKPDAMTAAWGGICCSQPPCVAVSIRKARLTYQNILERQAFTVNIASQNFVRQVDYLGMVSGRTTDKFADTGLTPLRSDKVNAPVIKEFPLVLECRLHQILEIGVHVQMIGEILDVKADESVLGPDNVILMDQLRPLLFAPGPGTYFGVGLALQPAFVTRVQDLERVTHEHSA